MSRTLEQKIADAEARLQFLKAEVTRQADVTRILPLINELEALPGQ